MTRLFAAPIRSISRSTSPPRFTADAPAWTTRHTPATDGPVADHPLLLWTTRHSPSAGRAVADHPLLLWTTRHGPSAGRGVAGYPHSGTAACAHNDAPPRRNGRSAQSFCRSGAQLEQTDAQRTDRRATGQTKAPQTVGRATDRRTRLTDRATGR